MGFTDTFCKMYEIPAARAIRRGPPGSTIIILKEIIRFNNNNLTRGSPRFLPTRGSSRRGVLPPLRGGNSWTKESPALPIPSYPALCREDTTSWNHGRPGTHHELQRITSCIHQLHGSIHVIQSLQLLIHGHQSF